MKKSVEKEHICKIHVINDFIKHLLMYTLQKELPINSCLWALGFTLSFSVQLISNSFYSF